MGITGPAHDDGRGVRGSGSGSETAASLENMEIVVEHIYDGTKPIELYAARAPRSEAI